MAEQRDDVLQLEQDLAQVIGVRAPVVHRAVTRYTIETGDPYAPLLMSLYWLCRENRQEHPIYQRFQSYLAQAQKEMATSDERRLQEEGAYRRGYQQGMGACRLYVLKQLERGKTKEEISARLAEWDKYLGDWRMALDAQGTAAHPPEPSW